jgi:hypothetical protein
LLDHTGSDLSGRQSKLLFDFLGGMNLTEPCFEDKRQILTYLWRVDRESAKRDSFFPKRGLKYRETKKDRLWQEVLCRRENFPLMR